MAIGPLKRVNLMPSVPKVPESRSEARMWAMTAPGTMFSGTLTSKRSCPSTEMLLLEMWPKSGKLSF